MTRHAQIAVTLCLVGLLLAVPAAGSSLYEADSNHELTTSTAINEYQATGNVTGDVVGLNMSLTVADTAAGVGLEEWKWVSTGRVFLRVDYNEGLERTIRFHVPDAYFEPRLKRDLQALTSDATISVEPAQNRTQTTVTIHVTGPTDAVFALSVLRGEVASGRSWGGDLISNATGFELPSLTSGGAEWSVIEASELADNETTSIPDHDPTIQYDAAPSPTAEQWVPVQTCDGSDRAVCSFHKTGDQNTTYLLSTTSDPPQVRWREGASITGGIASSINDAQHAVDELLEDVTGWVGG